jgi:peptidoglycan-associated lipoprotein
MRVRLASYCVLFPLILLAVGCGKKTPPVPTPMPPPASTQPEAPPPPPVASGRIDDALPVPAQPIGEDPISNRSLDDLNKDSPLRPAFFVLDSADLDDAARVVVNANADMLRKYPTWVVTIEGHCDERGTAEYNLALGERRAVAVKTYLVSLGISPDRLRTVSYGKEFPFDPGHTEESWSKNRRAQFVITSK